MTKKDKSRNFRMLMDNNFRIKNISTNSNSRFRNINQHTKMRIINEIAMQILTFKEIADKYNISLSAVKQINEDNRDEIDRLMKSTDENFNKIIKSAYCNADQTSIINCAQFKKDKYNNDEEKVISDEVDELEDVMDDTNEITRDESINADEIVSIESINDSIKPIEDPSIIHKKHAKITDDIINAVLNDLKMQCYTQRQIASRYNVSTSSVNRIKKKYEFKLINTDEKIEETDISANSEIQDPKEESVIILDKNSSIIEDSDTTSSIELDDESQNQEIQESSIYNNDTQDKEIVTEEITHLDELISIPTNTNNNELDEKSSRILSNESILRAKKKLIKSIKIGMIRNRHNMPINTFIFDNIDKDLIDDYQTQYDIAYERIKQLMSSVNQSNSVLSIYVTGLTSALASIIKACDDLNVNLTLLHYNPVKSSYLPQKIFNFTIDESLDTMPYELEDLQYRDIYTYKCDPYQFVNLPYGFTIIEYASNVDDYADIRNKDIILFTNLDDAWEYYIAACENAPDNYNVIFNKVHLSGNRLYVEKTISKMVNNNSIYKI